MAITRTQYITTDEYNEITGGTATDLEIYESSELLEYHMRNTNDYEKDDTNGNIAPNELKLATAYQVKYNQDNDGIDDSYANGNGSFSIGKYSESNSTGEKGTTEYKKIAPKADRYLILGGLINRII